jgi:cellulose synthase/poly-beta-1,6-N-acetylglucosamine synthase-like glycosyltransferase
MLPHFFCFLLATCHTKQVCEVVQSNRTALIDVLHEYERDLTTAVKQVTSAFPRSQVALRTDPLWSSHSKRFGHNPTVVHDLGMQLLQVIRYVAHMFETLSPTAYLSDDVHISSRYSNIELNIIIRTLLANVLDEPLN